MSLTQSLKLSPHLTVCHFPYIAVYRCVPALFSPASNARHNMHKSNPILTAADWKLLTWCSMALHLLANSFTDGTSGKILLHTYISETSRLTVDASSMELSASADLRVYIDFGHSSEENKYRETWCKIIIESFLSLNHFLFKCYYVLQYLYISGL